MFRSINQQQITIIKSGSSVKVIGDHINHIISFFSSFLIMMYLITFPY